MFRAGLRQSTKRSRGRKTSCSNPPIQSHNQTEAVWIDHLQEKGSGWVTPSELICMPLSSAQFWFGGCEASQARNLINGAFRPSTSLVSDYDASMQNVAVISSMQKTPVVGACVDADRPP
jgi:hypothetical protein